MSTFGAAFGEAFRLIGALDRALLDIVWLSLRVSLSAVLISTVVALPFGAALAVTRFPGRDALVVVVNALLGLPAVVVGLAAFGILFTPAAMVVAQAVLIFPLIAALARQAVADTWREYAEQMHSLGAGPVASSVALLHDLRFSLVTIVLAAFGRAIAEVGAVMIVGGNIDGVTRVMTTAIALETSKGDLPLALGLGIVLLGIVLVLNVGAHLLKERAQRHHA